MRVLHVAWAYRPLRGGGLIAYADDLMEMESVRGVVVGYLCAGRLYPGQQTPSLKKWQRGKITIFEIVNPVLVHAGEKGTFPMQAELGEPLTEQIIRRALDEFRPDVVHVHELAGMPFTLLDIVSEEYGIATVMTLHNYYNLCPTLNLFKYNNELCDLNDSLEICYSCCGKGDLYKTHLIAETLKMEKRWLRRYWFIFCSSILSHLHKSDKPNIDNDMFNKRRCENVKRLNDIDVIISQSNRTAEIHKRFIGRDDILVLHSSLSHIENLKPKVMIKSPDHVVFATLNGCDFLYKGAEVISGAVKILRDRGYSGRYTLQVWGGVHDSVIKSLNNEPGINLRGFYQPESLEFILKDVDVGIVPSLCEEVYGYAGIEFIAKGIPVIGNCRGGIVDYTIEKCTGWINESCNAEGLATIMENIINKPISILDLNRWIISNRNKVIVNRQDHLEAILNCYQLASARHEVCTNEQ